MRTACRNLLNASANWSVTGTGFDGKSYLLDFSALPQPATRFPVSGVTGNVSDQFSRIVQNGTVIDSGTSHLYFDATTLAQLGSDNGDGTCSQVLSNTAVPGSATIGAGGTLGKRARISLTVTGGFTLVARNY